MVGNLKKRVEYGTISCQHSDSGIHMITGCSGGAYRFFFFNSGSLAQAFTVTGSPAICVREGRTCAGLTWSSHVGRKFGIESR